MKIVIDNDYGLCNKLWSIVNPVVWSIKNRNKTLFISYDINYKYFPNLFFNRYLIFPLIYTVHSIGYRCVHKLHNILKKVKKERNKFSYLIWYGWNNIHDELDETDLKIIRRIFKPNKKILSKIEKKFIGNRGENSIIIGIHIRRGDYSHYREGRYFYTIEEYKEVMKKLIKNFHGKEVIFFIASNEPINHEDFSEFSFFYFGEKAIVDLYALSMCDYIIGPPSTFSMWAALIGGCLQSFIMIKNQNKFLFRHTNKVYTWEELNSIYV